MCKLQLPIPVAAATATAARWLIRSTFCTVLDEVTAMAWMIFGGQQLFRFIGYNDPPAIYFTLQEYGTQIAVALFFLLPQLVGQFATSGAFEVVLDGERVIWSKLQEGRFPNADELTNPLVKLGLTQTS
ncbi:selenoprotein T [Seminavis robusta]|uniref:Selenoprotein T n=1 Tax=Seminavis robusta TaxID=568900 RepID=A0A9N8EF25_9STRA|nr:selenoprotein T [Seminavis robusta]|eukprot:Sro906_g218650.1 selenoprotein T (129) ;mRNA; f:31039-31637